MSFFAKLKEFLFGPAVSVPDRHPLDGPTKRAIIEPAPAAPVAPAPAPVAPVTTYTVAPSDPPSTVAVTEPQHPQGEVWPFPTQTPPEAPPVQEAKKEKKPRKPRTPKVQVVEVAPPPVAAPAVKAKTKAKGKKK